MRSLRVRKTRSRERDGGIVGPVRGWKMEEEGGKKSGVTSIETFFALPPPNLNILLFLYLFPFCALPVYLYTYLYTR